MLWRANQRHPERFHSKASSPEHGRVHRSLRLPFLNWDNHEIQSQDRPTYWQIMGRNINAPFAELLRLFADQPMKCARSVGGKFSASKILLANSDAGIGPNASIAVPYRPTARPITVRRRCWFYVYGWRCIVAWAGDCGSDNGSCGEAAYDSGRHIPAACTHWRDPGSGEGQQESHDD
jgi:hypothetical protein